MARVYSTLSVQPRVPGAGPLARIDAVDRERFAEPGLVCAEGSC